MSEPIKKFCGAQLRLLVVIEILSGNELGGMCLKDVTGALAKAGHKVSPSTVLHDLEALEEGRWAERMLDDDKQWRLAAKPIQILANFQWGVQAAAEKLNDVRQRYTRLP